jgi:hypothetical protein
MREYSSGMAFRQCTVISQWERDYSYFFNPAAIARNGRSCPISMTFSSDTGSGGSVGNVPLSRSHRDTAIPATIHTGCHSVGHDVATR